MAGFAETQVNQALDWLESVGVTTWNLAALVGDGGRQVMKGGDRARDRAEVLKSVPWAGSQNSRLAGAIYMRPARWTAAGDPAAWPVVFFDDVPAEVVVKVRKKAMIIQTSPGRHHVWLVSDQPLV